jgi:diphthamide biosynthesis protein 4
MTPGPKQDSSNYYEILQLPRSHSSHSPAKEDVKAAYHRALLLHHPDKATKKTSTKPIAESVASATYSIDQIVAAYETLSDPLKRKTYNEQLEISYNEVVSHSSREKGTHLGVETFDLEDLSFNEDTNTWHHTCRCGNEEGYVLNEAELEREVEHGEIYVGCRGCSLFIKVVFGVAEEGVAT